MRAVAVLVVTLDLAGCDTSDTFALRNATSATLTVTISTTESFASDDCDSHEGNAKLGLGGTVTIAPGRRRCFDGPVAGKSYDAREMVVRLTVTRGATLCIDETGAELKSHEFVVEGYHDTWTIDDAACP